MESDKIFYRLIIECMYVPVHAHVSIINTN